MTTNHLISTLLLASITATGCAAYDGDAVDVSDSDEAILGGQSAGGTDLDAVGALAVQRHGRYEPFCTATLIAPKQVLTSESCADRYPANQVAFLVGAKASAPKKTVRAVGVTAEETLTGGVNNLGSDAAIVHLASAVTGIAPLKVAALTQAQVGKRFTVVGYGVRDSHGRSGVRYRGSMELRGISGTFYGHDLLDGVEAWLGGDNDDADLCTGDEGGPLLRKENGVFTTYGVASWIPRGCFGGAIYAAVNDAVQDLLAYQAACPLIPLEGVCQGDVAIRCARPNEGAFRILRNDCGELLQTCAVDAELDTVTCVDPV